MVKIEIKEGYWVNSRKVETLYHEYCPNPDCKSAIRLFYPNHFTNANCPECRTQLLGIRLMEGHGKRMAYHLEV